MIKIITNVAINKSSSMLISYRYQLIKHKPIDDHESVIINNDHQDNLQPWSLP